MSPRRSAIQHRRLHAPSEHGEMFVEPALSHTGELLESNQRLAANRRVDIQGRTMADLAQEARSLLLAEAQQATREFCDAPTTFENTARENTPPVILSGHQPQLFHPGVWVKNFVLDALARRHSAVAVNLQIDNDIIGAASMTALSGTAEAPHLEPIALDATLPAMPFEERRVVDESLFGSFASRVEKAVRGIVADPLVKPLFSPARDLANATSNLGQRIAWARRRLESDFGINNLELPLSSVCDSPPFAWFVVHMLANLPRFRTIYNEALGEYRAVHRLRSTSHPAPDLEQDNQWLEAPFWIWSEQSPSRRRLFVRQAGDQIEWTDRAKLAGRLALNEQTSGEKAAAQIAELRAEGVKIRPRALMTTLFARFFLCDLFLHGIGGSKYDQLTDALAARFWGVEPPRYQTISGTFQLHPASPRAVEEERRRVEQRLREILYHPECFLDHDHAASVDAAREAARKGIAAKRYWLSHDEDRKRRHQEIMRANAAMQPAVAPLRSELLARREQLVLNLRRDKLLASREYSFCLHSTATLPPLLKQLAEDA